MCAVDKQRDGYSPALFSLATPCAIADISFCIFFASLTTSRHALEQITAENRPQRTHRHGPSPSRYPRRRAASNPQCLQPRPASILHQTMHSCFEGSGLTMANSMAKLSSRTSRRISCLSSFANTTRLNLLRSVLSSNCLPRPLSALSNPTSQYR
jgi:hypothetical protein